MSKTGWHITPAAPRAHQSVRGSKAVYFILEGINAYATAYYFNYLFFLLRDQFGFGNRENLAVSASHGLIYFFAAWAGENSPSERASSPVCGLGLAACP